MIIKDMFLNVTINGNKCIYFIQFKVVVVNFW